MKVNLKKDPIIKAKICYHFQLPHDHELINLREVTRPPIAYENTFEEKMDIAFILDEITNKVLRLHFPVVPLYKMFMLS